MNNLFHDIMGIMVNISAAVLILGVIVFVNFAFSRDKVITRTMRHQ
jgi:small basic protein